MAKHSDKGKVRRFINRRASHDYFFLDEIEAGIVLVGTEIKSIREGKVNFRDSYARFENNEAWLVNLHISPYEKGTCFNHEPRRPRKLLLHKREIRRLRKKVDEQGLTVVPKEIYINDNGLCKVLLALAKGKHTYDKRESIREKDVEREQKRRLKEIQ
ncbi:MAG: SsrA-binding protein SmpB [Candidatus Cloacimonetes bacterium]|nr:SsrA-binding protein SmpB [Candidatus Cloacimonadota bacterium]